MNRKNEKIASVVALLLVIAQVALVLVSWIVSSALPEAEVYSLLSNDGIRWTFGNIVHFISSPLLVWLLLLTIAVSALVNCGITDALTRLFRQQPIMFRCRYALKASAVVLFLYLVIVCLLTLVPHAILLGITGELFPSSFSKSLIPIVAFGILIIALLFGFLSNKWNHLYDVMHAITRGFVPIIPWLVVYILAAIFVNTLLYVFFS